MIRKKLTREFFIQPTLKIAQDLLGKYIVRQFGQRKIIGQIVETEAYIGPQDKASHAYLGKKTKRNLAEYFIGGHIYIYLVYGMYWQFNISTNQEGKPECILLRALKPIFIDQYESITNNTYKNFVTIRRTLMKIHDLTNGPGKLCRFLRLNKSFYGEDLTKSKRIWLEDWGDKLNKNQIIATKRIGIDYAGKYWANKKWRFYIKDNKFVSKK